MPQTSRVVLGTLALAVIGVVPGWRAVGYVMAMLDLAARETLAFLTGVSLDAVLFWGRVRDASFVGVILPESWWLNRFLVALIGIPFPTIAGIVAARGVDVGWNGRAFFLVLAAVFVVPFIRNRSWFTLMLAAGLGALLIAFAVLVGPAARQGVLVFTAWLLLLGGFRWSAETAAGWDAPRSRATYLGALTGIPAVTFALGFVLVSLVALITGARWILS